MAIWRKRPVEISAWELTFDWLHELPTNVIRNSRIAFPASYFEEPYFTVDTLEGTMKGKVGDYLIQGVAGEYYICDREIFYKTYELIHDFT